MSRSCGGGARSSTPLCPWRREVAEAEGWARLRTPAKGMGGGQRASVHGASRERRGPGPRGTTCRITGTAAQCSGDAP